MVLHGGLQNATVLSEPGKFPSGVDSFRNGGLVAAANFGDTCNPGGVTFFVHGALKKTITSQSLSSAWFCAFDASGNLYVDGLDGNGQPTVGEIVGGVRGTKFIPLTTTNTIEAGVGIRVTRTGQIAILDQAVAVYTYNPPSSGSLGAPISTTITTGTVDPIGFASPSIAINSTSVMLPAARSTGLDIPAARQCDPCRSQVRRSASRSTRRRVRKA